MTSLWRTFQVSLYKSVSTVQRLYTRMASWRQTFTHTSIRIHPSILLKQTRSKTLNSPNMTPSFSYPLPVQCRGGRRHGSLADAPQDCSTLEAFSPRTVLTETNCRCVQYILQHFPTTMAFLTTSTITLSCLASAAPQADSWWRGHVEPDDVVIADIAGQALDIFLHGPVSARKNGILKSFTHTSIPIHTTKSNSKTLNSPNFKPSFSCPLLSNVLMGDSQEAWQMLLRTAPRRKPSRLGIILLI